MKKISFVAPPVFQNNRFFKSEDNLLNRDGLLAPMIVLKKEFARAGVDIGTQDIIPIETADAVIFENMPAEEDKDFRAARAGNKKMYLKISEWGALHRGNDDLRRHADFHKIFTYQDDLIDNRRYFKLNYSFLMPDSVPMDISLKRKLCVLVAGNKLFRHRYELYSKRREAIRWFEANHPENFDLYGVGWDRPASLFHYPFMEKIFRKLPLLGDEARGSYPSWRGRIEHKRDVLSSYRFAICYENACHVNGWITEKIFDCFFSGCVPVYWGAPNVTDHIPAEAFIDKRGFDNYDDLYQYLNNMPEDRYTRYLSAIEAFVCSPRSQPFSASYFADTILTEVMKDL